MRLICISLFLSKLCSIDLHFVIPRYKDSEVIFMYYIYIHKHKRTGEVMYCGKGSNSRYCNYNSRSDEHLKLMKQQRLEYIILKYFKVF